MKSEYGQTRTWGMMGVSGGGGGGRHLPLKALRKGKWVPENMR